MLEVIINRVKVSNIDWWLATTSNQSDDQLEILANRLGISVFRGSEDDVLSRFISVGEISKADWIIRLTADNPFVSSVEINQLVQIVRNEECKYDRICDDPLNRKYPLGFYPEVLKFKALKRIQAATTSENFYHRTHVSSLITNIKTIDLEPALRRPTLRWTVDENLDLEVARNVYSLANTHYMNLFYEDLIRVCDNYPEKCTLNSSVVQKKIEDG